MQPVNLVAASGADPTLGFGCSSLLGRTGRKASISALTAAYDSGITFYDTARSYGYGEAESMLGEFLGRRRHSVAISTKFGILPTPTNVFKEVAKPLMRQLLHFYPGARRGMKKHISAQFTSNQFSVPVLFASLETSLRKLRTDYLDLLFMHAAPISVLHQDDLVAALQQLVTEGKILRYGISSSPKVAKEALDANVYGLRSVQFPRNIFNLNESEGFTKAGTDVVAIANQPFGGIQRISESKSMLINLAKQSSTPPTLRDKLCVVDDAVLSDLVLNLIGRDTGIQVVVASMMRLDHLRMNIAALERSRFTVTELLWLRRTLSISGNG